MSKNQTIIFFPRIMWIPSTHRTTVEGIGPQWLPRRRQRENRASGTGGKMTLAIWSSPFTASCNPSRRLRSPQCWLPLKYYDFDGKENKTLLAAFVNRMLECECRGPSEKKDNFKVRPPNTELFFRDEPRLFGKNHEDIDGKKKRNERNNEEVIKSLI